MSDVAALLRFALAIAREARPIARQYFRSNCPVETKADASPVSRADREIESFLRATIAASFPTHAILGEEGGMQSGDSEYCWVIDPIDGTRAFLAGVPLFTTLIAITRNGVPVGGVIDQPILGESWSGMAGKGAEYYDASGHSMPLHTRHTNTLSEAVLSTTSPHYFGAQQAEAFASLRTQVRDCVYGYDAYAYAMLASGHLDLVVESGLKAHDFLALAPIITGSGGKITDWQGKALTLQSDGTVLAAATLLLHTHALEELRAA